MLLLAAVGHGYNSGVFSFASWLLRVLGFRTLPLLHTLLKTGCLRSSNLPESTAIQGMKLPQRAEGFGHFERDTADSRHKSEQINLRGEERLQAEKEDNGED